MISYEDQDSVNAKANYVLANQLGGIMIWQLAADDDQDTLVSTIAAVLSLAGGPHAGLRDQRSDERARR